MLEHLRSEYKDCRMAVGGGSENRPTLWGGVYFLLLAVIINTTNAENEIISVNASYTLIAITPFERSEPPFLENECRPTHTADLCT